MNKDNKVQKLLIVDDEPEIGELLSYNFRKKGFEVMTAGNGFSGLEALEFFEPDVVILDIMMPYVNGISMCREMKNNPRYAHIPVLFLSATGNGTLIQAALDAGGDRFLSKPIQLNVLINLVSNMKENPSGAHNSGTAGC